MAGINDTCGDTPSRILKARDYIEEIHPVAAWKMTRSTLRATVFGIQPLSPRRPRVVAPWFSGPVVRVQGESRCEDVASRHCCAAAASNVDFAG
jgi:hypothetical protein